MCCNHSLRALQEDAELVFAPYGYLIDPSIRRSMGLDLNGAIVIIDEVRRAHVLTLLAAPDPTGPPTL